MPGPDSGAQVWKGGGYARKVPHQMEGSKPAGLKTPTPTCLAGRDPIRLPPIAALMGHETNSVHKHIQGSRGLRHSVRTAALSHRRVQPTGQPALRLGPSLHGQKAWWFVHSG